MLYLCGDYITKEDNMHDNPQQTILYAYLAGIIDGEGTISISKQLPHLKSLSSQKLINPKYSAYISIGMAEKEIVEMLAFEFGSISVRVECVPGKKDIYRFKLTGRHKIKENLPKFTPYLMVKKRNAEIAMDFIDNYETTKPGNCLSEKELYRREDLYQKMRKLHHYRVVAETD